MKLHRIRLSDYRGISRCELHLADQGVTVVDGDNEAGKSSVAEAIDLILRFPDSSKHRRVMAVQPVGRDVGTEVEIEATVGGHRFVFTKRWHRLRGTTLKVLSPHPEQHRGREADQRLAELLAEHVDLGLWQALRVLQGAELAQPALATTSVARALDAALGGEVAGDREDALWDRIVAERDRYWTATGRPSVERVRLGADLLDAQTRRERAAAELRALDDAADELARLLAETTQMEAERVERESTEAELVVRAEQIAGYRGSVEQAGALVAAAEVLVAAAGEVLDARTDLVAEARLRAEEVEKREAEARRAQPARVGAEAQLAELEGELAGASGALARAEAECSRARADADHRRHEIERAQLAERHDRVVEAQARLSAAEPVLETNRIDEALVLRIEDATMAVVAAQAAVTASAPTLVLEELGEAATVQLDGQGLTPSASEVPLSGALEVTVPGSLRLRVAPSADAQQMVARLTDAEGELRRACAEAGVEDLADARRSLSERADAERTRKEAVAGIGHDLRDLTVDALAQKVERLSARIAEYRRDRPAEPALPADLEAAQTLLERTTRHLEECQHEVARLERSVSTARDAAAAARRADAGLERQLEQARAAQAEAERALVAARQRVSDSSLASRLAMAEADLAGRRAELASAEHQLRNADPDTVEALLGNARAVRRQLAERLQTHRDRQQELRGLLDHAGEQGLAQQLDEASTRLQHLTVERDHLERRAAAARLLYEAVDAQRTATRAAYAAPFRAQVERLGRIVFGPTFSVELDDDLRITSRTLEGDTVPLDDLSVGAREQLGILSRLSCAIIAAPSGGVPVVIDDALGWSDPTRLERMGAAIAVAGRECQVLVLTCTPGRYASVGGAHTVRLVTR